MPHSEDYRKDHLIAKVLIYFMYLLVGSASIELNSPYLALLAGTSIWLFGINPAAYLIEWLVGHAHRHHRI